MRQVASQKILTVGANARALKLLGHRVSRQGYEVFTADQVKDAIVQAIIIRPEVIISEFYSEDLDGRELLRMLDAVPHLEATPVIFLVADRERTAGFQPDRSGPVHFLQNPYPFGELMERIHDRSRPGDLSAEGQSINRGLLREVKRNGPEDHRDPGADESPARFPAGSLQRGPLQETARQVLENPHPVRNRQRILPREETICDPVTGLNNQHYLMLRLPEEIRRAERHHRNLSLIVITISRRELSVPDSLPSDEMLRQVAEILREAVRNVDILARLAPAQFAVLMPDTAEAVAGVAQRLSRVILSLPVRISVGHCTGPLGARTAQEMVEKARRVSFPNLSEGWTISGVA